MAAVRTVASPGVNKPEVSSLKLSVSLRLGLVLFVVLTSGCGSMASLQDWNYKFTNKARASSAWHECYDHAQRSQRGHDFEAGFKAGFVDSATGSDCRVPPVPPPKYWATKYQSCEGQTCTQNWFRGYQAGIVSAESHGYPDFHQVPVSAQAPILNRTACGTCYAPSPCACSSGDAVRHDLHLGNHSVTNPEVRLPANAIAITETKQGVRTAAVKLFGPNDLHAMQASHQHSVETPPAQNAH